MLNKHRGEGVKMAWNKNIPDFIYDVIIIGGGPAGLTAGLYTGRAGLKTLLIESLFTSGQAVITDAVENYPGFPDGIKGFDLIEKFKRQAEIFGLESSSGEVKNIQRWKTQNLNLWQVAVDDKTYNTLAIIVAVGARPKELGVPGENKLRGKGVSYCATCDGPFFRNRDIVVIGGGDTAVEEALFLTRFARKVILVHRRGRLRATKVLQDRALSHEKINFVYDSVATRILGETIVEGIRVKNLKTEEESDIPCQGVFIFVGLCPNTGFLEATVQMNKQGYIITDEDMKISIDGIYACGDCRQKLLRQIVTACGDGATAAFSAQRYVEELKGIAYK